MADLNLQLGPAKYMVTLAPGAHSTTWPEIVHRTRDITSCRILGDTSLDALHVLHVLNQILRGYLCNVNDTAKRRVNPAAVFDGPSPTSSAKAWAYRLEFQEGTQGTLGFAGLDYHGTGLPHIHAAILLDTTLCAEDLHKWIRADIAQEYTALNAAVLRIQSLREDAAPRMRIRTASQWVDGQLQLKHSEDDERAGVHPYIAPLCLSHFCHAHVSAIRNKHDVANLHDKSWASHLPNTTRNCGQIGSMTRNEAFKMRSIICGRHHRRAHR